MQLLMDTYRHLALDIERELLTLECLECDLHLLFLLSKFFWLIIL